MSRDASDSGDEWTVLRRHWCSQPLPDEWPAVHAEIERRGRRLRLLRVLDLAIAMVALAMCAWAGSLPAPRGLPPALCIGLAMVVLAYTAWAQWQRRNQWRIYESTPTALLALERRRTLTSMRIWRASVWLSLGMWCVLIILAMLASHGHAGGGWPPASVWMPNILVNAVVLVATASVAWIVGRRSRRRLATLDRLERSLRGND